MTDKDRLDEAAELARREAPAPPADWERTRDEVLRRVRTSVRPGRPVDVPLTDDRGSRTWVNERVLVAGVRRAVRGLDGVAASRISPVLDGGRCLSLEVDVVARYGLELHHVAERTHEAVRVALAGLLLEDAAAVDVHVAVVDLTLDDPDV